MTVQVDYPPCDSSIFPICVRMDFQLLRWEKNKNRWISPVLIDLPGSGFIASGCLKSIVPHTNYPPLSRSPLNPSFWQEFPGWLWVTMSCFLTHISFSSVNIYLTPALRSTSLYIQSLLVSNGFTIHFHLVFSPISKPQHQTEQLVEETGTLEDGVSQKVRTTQRKGKKQVGGRKDPSRNVFIGREAKVHVWGTVSRKTKRQSHKEDLKWQADKVRFLSSRE